MSRSIRRHLVGIEFEQFQAAVGDVLGLIDPVAELERADQKIPAGDESKVSPRGRFQGPPNDGRVIDPGDRRSDVQLVPRSIEQLDEDARVRPGRRVFQDLEQLEVQRDLPLAQDPGLPLTR